MPHQHNHDSQPNPYSSHRRANPWQLVGCVLVIAGVLGLYCSQASQASQAKAIDPTVHAETMAQAKIDAFVAVYPENTWTDQTAEAVHEEQLEIESAQWAEKQAAIGGWSVDYQVVAQQGYASIDMSKAERLMFCEQQLIVGSAVGFTYVTRPGTSKELAAKWCSKDEGSTQ